MLRSYGSSFPQTEINTVNLYNSGLTCADIAQATEPAWTPGGYAICSMPLQPPALKKWNINSVSVAGNLSLFSVNGLPIYGKLGKVTGGMTTAQSITTGSGVPGWQPGSPWNQGNSPPLDSTLVATMWDPSSDPLPPLNMVTAQAPAIFNRIACTVQPPQPVSISSGGQVNIGIWIGPSLLGPGNGSVYTAGLAISGAVYTVVYDDNP
jgi:hypothetical protein